MRHAELGVSTQQVLLEQHVRPLYDYYRTELPRGDQAKLAADMDKFLLERIRAWSVVGRIALCGADLWFQLVTLCYQLLIRSGTAGALDVARGFADQVPEVLASSLALGDRMCFYDMLKHLFFMAGADFPDYRPFDARVVRPYAAWMRTLDGGASGRRGGRLPRDRRLRIGYLCNYAALLAPGRVASPLFVSMMLDHRQHLAHDCVVYSSGEARPEWQAFMAELGLAVTPLPFTGYATHGDCGFPEAVAMLRDAALDLLLTDDNLALPAFAFEHRVASVQVYVAVGMPFWGLANLDYILLGSHASDACPDLPPERKIVGRYGYSGTLLDHDNDPAAIAAARADVPAGHRVAGTFSRFVRVGDEFLSAIGRILDENPDLTIMIAGNGDPGHIKAFVAGCPHRDRIRFFDHDVDILAYGRAIDFFLDTLPLCCGNVCREVQYFGKPVVSLENPDYARYLAELRDPELLCPDVAEYVRRAGRLVREPAYLQARSRAAREIGGAQTRAGNNADLLRELIARASA